MANEHFGYTLVVCEVCNKQKRDLYWNEAGDVVCEDCMSGEVDEEEIGVLEAEWKAEREEYYG
jgi:transcription initiation factor TFIIIB Brf1 subunit/transcription initiation factor TFIIB